MTALLLYGGISYVAFLLGWIACSKLTRESDRHEIEQLHRVCQSQAAALCRMQSISLTPSVSGRGADCLVLEAEQSVSKHRLGIAACRDCGTYPMLNAGPCCTEEAARRLMGKAPAVTPERFAKLPDPPLCDICKRRPVDYHCEAHNVLACNECIVERHYAPATCAGIRELRPIEARRKAGAR